jgi:Tfp pilus assembly protein FimV
MTATALRHPPARPARTPRPRLVPSPPPSARPAARPVRQAPEVYRRRRMAVLALVTVLGTVLLLVAGQVRHADADLDGPPPVPEVYVVQPGDTLWSIAAEVAPDVDRRDVVAQLDDAAGGSELVPGQRIELPRFFD